MKASEFPWPTLDGHRRPQWLGTGFRVGDDELHVLPYHAGESGWSDDLTQLHEESAGDDHPIDILSRARALSAVRRHVLTPTPVVLEVGCSSGFFLRDLQASWPDATVIGADFVNGPLERLSAIAPGIPLLQFDLVRCPLPDACADAVVLLNVLEHIENDGEAMRQVARTLKPGGVAIVEVPSGPHLYDVYDAYLRHYRRYAAASLASLMTAAGLTVVEQSHIGFFLYPAFALVKRWNRRSSTTEANAQRRAVESNIRHTRASRLVRQLVRCEAWMADRVSLPFGIRCVAVGRKPLKERS